MTNNINNKMNSEFKFQDNQSCELSFNIDKALNNDKKTLLKINEFNETINLPKVRYLSGLSIDELKNLFWDADELDAAGEKYDMKVYLKDLHQWLISIVKASRCEGLQDVEFFTTKKSYRRTGNKRMFVNGFGLQRCQNKIRRFLSGDSSYDIDMSKCHWNIIVKKCSEYDISCPRILKFLNNPDEYMAKNNVTKHDLLILLYVDNYTSKNNALNHLHSEKQFIFENLIETLEVKKLNFKPKDKSKNPISSVMSQFCQHLECEILIPILTKHQNVIEVLMFDGVQVNISVDVVTFIEDLNQLTEYTWIQKDNTYEIEDWENEEMNDYITLVKDFESKIFAINEPERLYALNYDTCKFLLSTTKLYDRFPEKLDFVKQWVGDESKRVYDRFVYKPYNALSQDPTPENEYNTWKPYQRTVSNEIITEDEISWFTKLIEGSIVNYKNLQEPDSQCKKEANWIKNWISRMIQYPDENMGIYPVLFGKQGGGKDTLVNVIAKLIGEDLVLRTSNIEDVIGEGFNGMLYGKQLILLNENTSMDIIKVNGHIKNHVTADKLVIREKYQPQRTIDNFTNILFATNNPYPFDPGCRRTQGFETRNWRGSDKKNSPAFFSEIYDCMEDEVKLNKLWTYLNQRNVKDWKARNNLFETHLTQQVKNNNTPDWVKFCHHIVDCKFQYTNDFDEISTWCGVKAFKDTFKEWKYEEKGDREFNYNITMKHLLSTDAWVKGRDMKGQFIKVDIKTLESYLKINYPRED